MDTVINKISEIEASATAIMDDANEQKKVLAKEMEAQIQAFDAQLEAETQARIDQLTKQMEADLEKRLSKQKSDSQRVLEMMEKAFGENHEAYAKALFEEMIRE